MLNNEVELTVGFRCTIMRGVGAGTTPVLAAKIVVSLPLEDDKVHPLICWGSNELLGKKITDNAKTLSSTHWFAFTPDGGREAIEWLNAKKIEVIDALKTIRRDYYTLANILTYHEVDEVKF